MRKMALALKVTAFLSTSSCDTNVRHKDDLHILGRTSQMLVTGSDAAKSLFYLMLPPVGKRRYCTVRTKAFMMRNVVVSDGQLFSSHL